MIQVSGKHRVVAVPATAQIAGLFPEAKTVTHGGNTLMVIPHGPAETKLLRAMGHAVPSPILSQYDWGMGSPFDVQKKTAALLTTSARAYVLNGMGTGKTKASLWAWDFLNLTGHAGKLLVVAPLSTLNFTWGREVFSTLPGRKVQVLHGTKPKRLAKLADTEADIYIVNHDGLGIIAEELLKRKDIDTIVFDELATYRNGTATRTKIARKVAAAMKWAWGMTGSPTPNSPTDAWGQCSVLTPHTVPKSFVRFRDDVMTKITNFKFAPKPDALDTVMSVMQPAVRFTLDDVVELPELVERTVEVELGPRQAKVYKELESAARSMVASQEITAVNAGVVLNKLLQVSTGYVYDNKGSVVTLDNSPRMNALVDAVDATDRKVIVFVPFVHALDAIRQRLEAEGYDVRAVHGGTAKSERDQTFSLFQNTGAVKVIVAHPQCMAHGLTLTAADTIIWFAPTPNLEIFEQANARIRRIGQKNRQLILMFCATKAERRMYTKLRAKQRVQDMLLDLFAEATE